MTKEELKEWEQRFEDVYNETDSMYSPHERIKKFIQREFDLYKKELVERIVKELKGIDSDELESDDGWWETSTGAEFGKKKLEAIIKLINNI